MRMNRFGVGVFADQPVGRPVALEGNRNGRIFIQLGIQN